MLVVTRHAVGDVIFILGQGEFVNKGRLEVMTANRADLIGVLLKCRTLSVCHFNRWRVQLRGQVLSATDGIC